MVQSALFKIKLKLFGLRLRQILQVRTEIRINIFRRLYLDACEMFPTNTLSESGEIAITVTEAALGLESSNLSVDETNVGALRERILNDSWVAKNIADYHRITAYYFSFNGSGDMHSEHVEDAMLKAKQAIASVERLDKPDFIKISENSKKEKRLLRKRIKVCKKSKLQREKLNIIKPVKITSSHFSVALTLISTMFLISGFIYTKVFFYWFGINVGDFYNIQDYLSSSIDVISSTALSAFLGLVFLFLGFNRAFNEELHDEQLDIQEKHRDYVWPIIITTSCIGLAVSIYTNGRWPTIFVFPIVFAFLMHIYFRIPLWKFVENKVSVGTVCLVIVFFFMHLGFTIKHNVENILLEDYEPIYSIELQREYEKYSQMSYVTSNSNFVFLIDVETKEVVVLPKHSVASYKING